MPILSGEAKSPTKLRVVDGGLNIIQFEEFSLQLTSVCTNKK